MIGLDRPKLMALAQLLGGDYCEGVAGEGRPLLRACFKPPGTPGGSRN